MESDLHYSLLEVTRGNDFDLTAVISVTLEFPTQGFTLTLHHEQYQFRYRKKDIYSLSRDVSSTEIYAALYSYHVFEPLRNSLTRLRNSLYVFKLPFCIQFQTLVTYWNGNLRSDKLLPIVIDSYVPVS